jgi:hypothetical protein
VCISYGASALRAHDDDWDVEEAGVPSVEDAGRVTTYCYNTSAEVIQAWRPWDTAAPPSVLSGPVVDHEDALNDGGWELDVSASDGTAAAPQSGVANLNLYIDGDLNPENDSQPQDTCTDHLNCTLDAEFTVDVDSLTAGAHELTVVARDFAGNTSTKTLHVTTSPDPDNPENQGSSARGAGAAVTPAACTGPAYATFYDGSAVQGNAMIHAERRCDDAAGHHETTYVYGSCTPSTNSDVGCQPPLVVNSAPLCERHAKLYKMPDGTTLGSTAGTVKGVPTATYGGGVGLEIYTADTTVTINAATGALATAAAAAIRAAPAANQPSAGSLSSLPVPDTTTSGASSLTAPNPTTLNATVSCS